MESWKSNGGHNSSLRDNLATPKSVEDLWRQASFSSAFGIAAFLGFCILRPRWTSLYSARKKRKAAASSLPTLPKTMFGWIPVVYNITEEEVLHSAGLDAFVFLAFLKMAVKYVAFLLFFALVVVYPVYKTDGSHDHKDKHDDKSNGTSTLYGTYPQLVHVYKDGNKSNETHSGFWPQKGHDRTQFVFVYLYTFVAMWLILKETQRMIRVRQKYLAHQSYLSDRTIRLSGIPEALRDEAKIKQTIEDLEIGQVERVTLCRRWNELDDLVEERQKTLRRLEESWSTYLGTGKASRKMRRRYRGEDEEPVDVEQASLLSGDDIDDGAHVVAYNKPRPEMRIWYGFMSLQSRKVDAIDYHEERLRRLDERIKTARKKEFPATSLAFVTLDSTAACQMACQAILDPQPMQLIANPSPAPDGVVWRNTYLSRRNRMFRAWTVTGFVLVLTVFWSILLFPIGGAISDDSMEAVLPQFFKWLKHHKTAKWAVTSGVPTLLVAILNTVVPYLYEFLSYRQGMTSLGDVEMSLISKNFFFVLVNLLIIFTIIGSGTQAAAVWSHLQKNVSDLPRLSRTIFNTLSQMSSFYLNYLILQTLGLFPFKLLQFGTVFLYPFYRMFAKTPRDYSELAQPSNFTYGFYVPQALFTLAVCLVYAVLPNAELVELLGVIYFGIASFVYKYQLLYSMDHRQFSTGKAWPMMCLRFMAGLILFQLVAIGNLVTDSAVYLTVLVIPLVIGTIWFATWYKRTYEPLMQNIALRSLREVHEVRMEESIFSGNGEEGSNDQPRETTNRSSKEQFVNPSLTIHLEEPWIARTAEREAEIQSNGLASYHDEESSEQT